MKKTTIVYKSNTGSTEKYAKMIGKKIGSNVYSLDEAKKKLAKGDSVIYLGWVFANIIKGYKKALKRYDVEVVCAVGMNKTLDNLDQVRKANSISDDFPLFTLQGGLNREKLKGINKMMINMIFKSLSNKENRNEDEEKMYQLFIDSSNPIKEENLDDFLNYYNEYIAI